MPESDTPSSAENHRGSTASGRPESPRGIIPWIRRRLLPWSGKLWALLGVLVLAGWLTGRILTDEHLWSQYLYWVPTLWVIGIATIAWGLSWLSGLLATRMSGDLIRPVLAVATILTAGWMLTIEWRGYRIVRLPINPAAPSVRVAFWNNSSKAHLEGAELDLEKLAADITVISNPTSSPAQLKGLLESLGRVVNPTQEAPPRQPTPTEPGLIPDLPSPSLHLVRRYGLIVASRLPILRMGDTWLEESEGADADWRTAGYGGRAVFVELDASGVFPDLGRPLILWVFDLPSDPSLHRLEPARKAKRAIERFSGPVLEPNDLGVLVRTNTPAEGFPSPDLVVGDFNTPRGSASFRTVIGALANAHDQAGFGPDTTWDQPWAWWAIDQMFVGERFGARRFDAKLLHHHAHSVIVGDVGLAPD